MPRFWGFHQMPRLSYSELRFWEGKTFTYATPIDPQMKPGDYVYLFWGFEMLYGWGMIQQLKPLDDAHNEATILIAVSRPPVARFNEEINTNTLFTNYESQIYQGCLATYNDDQLHFLNARLRGSAESSPPNPEEVREQSARAMPIRPFPSEFVFGEKVPMDETRFVEYKQIKVPDPLPPILKEVDAYVIGFLNLEDRRYEDYCRLLFGVRNSDHVVVGVLLNHDQRDQVRLRIGGKLKKISPPLAPSSFFVELRQVQEKTGSPIHDLYVVEVVVGRGETGFLYCSENDSFYIKLDASNEQLKGQALVAEIKRRIKLGLL
jgi:hypothetical protein